MQGHYVEVLVRNHQEQVHNLLEDENNYLVHNQDLVEEHNLHHIEEHIEHLVVLDQELVQVDHQDYNQGPLLPNMDIRFHFCSNILLKPSSNLLLIYIEFLYLFKSQQV